MPFDNHGVVWPSDGEEPDFGKVLEVPLSIAPLPKKEMCKLSAVSWRFSVRSPANSFTTDGRRTYGIFSADSLGVVVLVFAADAAAAAAAAAATAAVATATAAAGAGAAAATTANATILILPNL